MTCPFRNFTYQTNDFCAQYPDEEPQNDLVQEIYALEASIVKTRKHLNVLRRKRVHIEEENRKKRMGTVTNVQLELQKIQKWNGLTHYNKPHKTWNGGIFKTLDNLFTSILYTLKSMDERLTHLENSKTSEVLEEAMPTHWESEPLIPPVAPVSPITPTHVETAEEAAEEAADEVADEVVKEALFAHPAETLMTMREDDAWAAQMATEVVASVLAGVESEATTTQLDTVEEEEATSAPEASDDAATSSNGSEIDWHDNEEWGTPATNDVAFVDYKNNDCHVPFDDKCRCETTASFNIQN